MPLPSITELGAMGGLDPFAFSQAQNQVSLGNQQAQQGLEQGAANLQATGLQNLFNEQNNPQLVQAQGQINQGRGYTNREAAVKAQQTEDLSGADTNAKRAKMLADLDEDTLKSLTAKGEAFSIRGAGEGNADMEAAGKRMMEAGRKELAARAAQGSKEDIARQQAEAKLAGYQAGLQGRMYAADRGLEGRKYAADTIAKVKAATANGTPKTMEAAYVKAIGDLQANPTDPAAKEYADAMYDTMMAARQAASGTKIDTAAVADMPKIGTPTRPPITQQRTVAAPEQGSSSAATMETAPGTRPVVPPSYQQQLNATQAETLQREYLKTAPGSVDEASAARELAAIKAPVPKRPAAAPTGLPPGSKQIGTSGGRPVYQTPDGNQFIGK